MKQLCLLGNVSINAEHAVQIQCSIPTRSQREAYPRVAGSHFSCLRISGPWKLSHCLKFLFNSIEIIVQWRSFSNPSKILKRKKTKQNLERHPSPKWQQVTWNPSGFQDVCSSPHPVRGWVSCLRLFAEKQNPTILINNENTSQAFLSLFLNLSVLEYVSLGQIYIMYNTKERYMLINISDPPETNCWQDMLISYFNTNRPLCIGVRVEVIKTLRLRDQPNQVVKV